MEAADRILCCAGRVAEVNAEGRRGVKTLDLIEAAAFLRLHPHTPEAKARAGEISQFPPQQLLPHLLLQFLGNLHLLFDLHLYLGLELFLGQAAALVLAL